MSLIFMDSFDDGLSSQKWTQFIAGTISTATPRTGTSYLNGTTNGVIVSRSFAAADRHATFIVGMGYRQVSNADRIEMTFLNLASDATATVHLGFRRNDDGSISIYRGGIFVNGNNNGGTLLATSAPNIILVGNWYHIEIKAVLHDTTGSVDVRVNNTSVVSFAGDTKNGGTETVFSSLRVFSNAGGDSQNSLLDDFYVLNGAGTLNNDFKGDSRIHNLLPDGNGNYSQFVGSDGNSVDNYLLVDEAVPNVTDYVGSGIDGNKDSYAFPDLPAPVTAVWGAAQRAYAISSDAGTRAARNLVRIAGADFTGPDYNVGAAALMFESLYDASPATTVQFTVAEFNGAEWGIECRA